MSRPTPILIHSISSLNTTHVYYTLNLTLEIHLRNLPWYPLNVSLLLGLSHWSLKSYLLFLESAGPGKLNPTKQNLQWFNREKASVEDFWPSGSTEPKIPDGPSKRFWLINRWNPTNTPRSLSTYVMRQSLRRKLFSMYSFFLKKKKIINLLHGAHRQVTTALCKR